MSLQECLIPRTVRRVFFFFSAMRLRFKISKAAIAPIGNRRLAPGPHVRVCVPANYAARAWDFGIVREPEAASWMPFR